MVGSAIGDAFGAVIEFQTADKVKVITGGQTWVDDLFPYPTSHEAHEFGTWIAAPPRGTGTDDTRNNHIFTDCVIRNQGKINSQLLAIEYLERYRDRARFYPQHQVMAEKQYRWLYDLSCAYLGMNEDERHLPGWVLTAQGTAFPMLIGLIHLSFAGLLYRGDPEQAYRKAFELSFFDTGYARDATAMMAAMISAALTGDVSGREMVQTGLDTNPFGYGDPMFGGRVMADRIKGFLELADSAGDDQALVRVLAQEVAYLHPYDPVDVLGIAATAVYATDGEAVHSIVIAANDRYLDEQGGLKQFRDVDCTAGVAGALVGALRGIEAFPKDWVDDVISANKTVYGIDLEANARAFYDIVYGVN
jgi:ADP-ribosylglycohydrolase